MFDKWYTLFKMSTKRVLITGGSEGIGLAFAKRFAKENAELILVAKNPIKLEEAKKELSSLAYNRITTIAIDLSEKDAPLNLYNQLSDKNIDILINNAGFSVVGESVEIPIDKDEDMLMVNAVNAMSLTKLFLKDMIKKGEGVIINVASLGAFTPGPYIASYYASKSFMLNYTKAINAEINNSHIHIYCLCPGPINTNFHAKANDSLPKHSMSAEACVEYMMKYMHSRKVVIIPGLINKLSLLFPESIRMWFIKRKKTKTINQRKTRKV